MNCISKILLMTYAVFFLIIMYGAAMAKDHAASVVVNLKKQMATITLPDGTRFATPVSTGKKGFRTPIGRFRVGRRYKMWHSRKYDNAPMKYSMFFNEGYAMHVGFVSRPFDSHGCIRLPHWAAKRLFNATEGVDTVVTIR